MTHQDDQQELSNEIINPKRIVMTMYSSRITSGLNQTSNDQTNVERQISPSWFDEEPVVGECDEDETDDSDYTEGESWDVAV